MIDWSMVATIVGGGFGTTIFVLVVLSLVAWIFGLLAQRFGKATPEDKPNSE